MFYEPHLRDKSALPHDPIKALIAPRPIGWMTTISGRGELNLAPYSFFNQFYSTPAILGFSSDGRKDSIRNLEEIGEFVWSLPNYALKDAMNATSASYPHGVNEAEAVGLTLAPSHVVRPPRVAAAPAALECKLTEIVRLKRWSGEALDGWLALGEVVGVYVDDRFVRDGRVDTRAMRPIARCGYDDYAVIDDLFQMRRPGPAGNGSVSPAAPREDPRHRA
jgi:flavin reductase (DIM6/NTAB) family NADH-FMN oxidoreductase RutF